MNFNIGDTVGGYEIVGVLGAGGMGEVYRVRNVISDRVDAMKVLLAGLQHEHDFATRFLREIKVQARLVHPNIAQVYTAFENQGNLMMILELIDGWSLADMLQRARVPLVNAIDYASQALTALSYAHQQGVIHRDIKPGNIMVTRTGTVKLMDFGIAKAAHDRALTITGNLIGSLYYMSPEQVRAETLDGRADLYSLGIVLYQMATGRKPFDGGSEYTIMRAQVEQAPVDPREVDSSVPEDLSRVILRALEKDPATRFQSGEEFRVALQHVAANLWQTPVSAISRTPAPVAIPESIEEPTETAQHLLAQTAPPQQTAPRPSPFASSSGAPTASSKAPPSRTVLWVGVGVAIAALVVLAAAMVHLITAPEPIAPETTAAIERPELTPEQPAVSQPVIPPPKTDSPLSSAPPSSVPQATPKALEKVSPPPQTTRRVASSASAIPKTTRPEPRTTPRTEPAENAVKPQERPTDPAVPRTEPAPAASQPAPETTAAPPPTTPPEPAPTPAERIFDPKEVDTPPRLLQQVQPLYTQAARAAGVQGRVRLEAEIWPDGRAHNIRVVQSVGHPDLDHNAVVALSRWQFSPGIKGGQAIKVRALIDQNYRLQAVNSAPVLSK